MQPRRTRAGGKRVILLVDDQETPILVTRSLLRERDFEFVVARDGQEAIDKARAVRPDLILLDIEMPKLDGIAAAQALRADPATESIPIIMVTSRSDQDGIERAYLGGCTDYVLKPIHADELLAKIDSVIEP